MVKRTKTMAFVSASSFIENLNLSADDYAVKHTPKESKVSDFQILVTGLVKKYLENYLGTEIKLVDLTSFLRYHLFEKQDNLIASFNNNSEKKIETTKLQTYNITRAFEILSSEYNIVTNDSGIKKTIIATKK